MAGDWLNAELITAESIADKVTSGVVVTLGRGGEVWLFNQDKFPVFVSSPTLEGKTESVVLKIEAGHCSRIFDPTLFLQCEKLQQFLPVDPYSINVSLMKGFGPAYKRTRITSCPCWFQVILNLNVAGR